MGIRCLSLLQPYADAYANGPKDVENRSRKLFNVPPGGMWVGIHASLGWWDVDLSELWPEAPTRATARRGVVLGVVHIARCEVFDGEQLDELPFGSQTILEKLGPWAFGPVCYVADRKIPLAEPMPCKGARGLWTPPEHIGNALDALIVRDVGRSIGALAGPTS